MANTPNPTPRTTNILAVVSLICGLLGLAGGLPSAGVINIAAIVMGHMGRAAKSAKTRMKTAQAWRWQA